MLKNLTIRLKMALIYVEMTLFTVPMIIISYIIMRQINNSEIHAADKLVSTFGIVYIVYLIVYVFTTLMLGRKLTSLISFPLRDLERTASQIASGNVDATPEYESNDEVGQLADKFRVIVESIKEQSKTLSIMASGDYTTSITIRSAHDIMNQSISQLISRNNEILRQISASTAQVSISAKQVSETAASIANNASGMADGAQTLAAGAAKQADSVEVLSDSMALISDKTSANANMTLQAVKLADTIIKQAEKGDRHMNDMIKAVDEITEASKSIRSIIETIDNIAIQTNLLSLNAAIEAAQAGEHGKSFAVVAEEVRKLAAQSADSVKETSSIIQNSIQKAELGAKVAQEMASSLKEIVVGITESSQLVMQIAKSSEEQSASISQVNASIHQVANIVEQNSAVAQESAATAQESAAAAQESAAAADEMIHQFDILEELVSQFKLKDVHP